MKIYFYILIQTIIISYNNCYGQIQERSNSFIHPNIFNDVSGCILAICSTSDSGFAYIPCGGGYLQDTVDFRLFSTSKTGSFHGNYKSLGLITKVNKKGETQWMNGVFVNNKNNDILSGSEGGYFIKQTSDGGYLTTRWGVIVKLDDQGIKQWEIVFGRDTIPTIPKTKFLKEACITDIHECRDGSFIALTNASFSLIKISKEGKVEWLKSMVPYGFQSYFYSGDNNSGLEKSFYDKSKKDKAYKESLGIDSSYIAVRLGGVNAKAYNVYETEDKGFIAIAFAGRMEMENNKFIYDTMPDYKRYYTLNEKNQFITITPHRVVEQNKATTKSKMLSVVKTDSLGNREWVQSFNDCILTRDD
ncbi:MAG: hypothetical protein ACOC3T_02535, partial [Bacteroidota bacterium]